MTDTRRIDSMSLAAAASAVLIASPLLRHLGLMECWIECIFFLCLP